MALMRRGTCLFYIAFLLQWPIFNEVCATPNIRDKTIIEDGLCKVGAFDSDKPDKQGALRLHMIVKKYASGVASSLNFELLNDTNRNLMITSFSATNEMFRTDIFVQHQQISKDHKNYAIDGKETVKMGDIFLKPGEKRQWDLSINAVLKDDLIAKKLLQNKSEGDLIVVFSFVPSVHSDGCDKKGKLTSMYYGQTELFSLESYLPTKPPSFDRASH